MGKSISNIVPHSTAVFTAVLYGWQIAFGPYATTGLMFAGPVLVMMVVYCAFDALQHSWKLEALRIFKGMAVGGLSLLIGVLFLLSVMPMPSFAESTVSTGEKVMAVIMCTTVLAIVVFLIALVIWLFFKLLVWLFSSKSQNEPNDKNKLNNFASLAIVFGVLGTMSLEGTPFGFAFAPEGEVSVQIDIAAPPEAVWTAMKTASSPTLELPLLLSMLPHPVSVLDEGGTPGAKRIVHFAGREGVGDMVLVAQPRIGNRQTWLVTSDTTPLAQWAQLQAVNYLVEPIPNGTRLTVKSNYLRCLSPAWFFTPYMNVVVGEATKVLAKDKHDRAM